ncbi:MAG TPA: hypothetical protein VD788_03085 [Candidatus Polarisedimenticolaceae bacterium]|nr:hypothetical protein [Candidatus Polarisedimenticolaceae bacterium]
MRLVTVIVVLAVCLAFRIALGAIWPGAARYVDVMIVPVVWYAIAGSQRSAMLVGCAAGLLQDSWFQTGAFGTSGFKKTLVGWLLGGLGSRFDLNNQFNRFVFGTLASVSDSLLGLVLHAVLDRPGGQAEPLEIGTRALVSGLLVSLAFGLTDRLRVRRSRRSLA